VENALLGVKIGRNWEFINESPAGSGGGSLDDQKRRGKDYLEQISYDDQEDQGLSLTPQLKMWSLDDNSLSLSFDVKRSRNGYRSRNHPEL